MITKQDYCRSILCHYKPMPTSATEKFELALSSTSAGIAMEVLGMLEDPDCIGIKEYLSHRGGIVTSYYNKEKNTSSCLTLRELLDLLPNE